jgi:hypothetical protein
MKTGFLVLYGAALTNERESRVADERFKREKEERCDSQSQVVL